MGENNKRILVVDDEEAMLFGFTRVLQSPALDIDTAQSLDEAKKLIQNKKYHVIIADLRLTNSTIAQYRVTVLGDQHVIAV